MLEKNINYVKKTTEKMVENIEGEIGKEISIALLPKIVKMVELKSESQLGRLTNMVRITSSTIKDRVRRNTNTRTLNLINNFNSSYETVNLLNEKTCNKNMDQISKQKVKKVA